MTTTRWTHQFRVERDPEFSGIQPTYEILKEVYRRGYALDPIEGAGHGQGYVHCDYCICVYDERSTYWCRCNLLCGCHRRSWPEHGPTPPAPVVIEFVVEGRPVPKAKLTAGQKWGKVGEKARQYGEWKQEVQRAAQPAIIAAAIDMPTTDPMKILKGGNRYLKPITIEEKIRMDILIHFPDETHGDPENIFGSIADALFVNDKHLKGSFDFCHAADGKGRVEVKITIKQ